MFASPSEICFSIFGLDIYYYGILMACAVLVGVSFSNFVRRKYYSEILESDFFDIALVSIIAGFLGARLYYCLFSYTYYSKHFLEIFDFRQGGLSIHGGVLFGLIFGILFAKRKNVSVLKMADIFAYGIILAQAIGRWGNFFNSEAFGKPTDIFCKLYIPINHRPLEYVNYEYFHPTFLYESILNVLIFLILFFVLRKVLKNFDGFIFCSYLILYSIARILVEHLRIDSILSVYSIPLPIVVSVIIIIFSFIMMICIYKNHLKMLK